MLALSSSGMSPKKSSSKFIRLLIGSFLCLCLGLVIYFRIPGSFPSRFFIVYAGDSLKAISTRLKTDGIIYSDTLFRLGLMMTGKGKTLQAGDYLIPENASPYEIAQLLLSTQGQRNKITIPEGLTNWQILAILKTKSFLKDDNPVLPPEGMLYPETYVFPRGTRLSKVIAEMHSLMEKNLLTLWAQRSEELPLKSFQEALILASIVEKEAFIEGEKPLIAGVYLNRLRANMLLQADPTIIYGLSKGRGILGRPLVRSDMLTPNPFNTYRFKGLPPTPIASPSLSSLKAVLIHPEKTNALYFVADGKGGHRFSAHYHHHRTNIGKLRGLRFKEKKNEELKSKGKRLS